MSWVCEDCGRRHGRAPCTADEFVRSECSICGAVAMCAAPSDFGGIDLPGGKAMEEEHGDN